MFSTALCFFVARGDVKCVRVLLKAGANPNLAHWGNTPMQVAWLYCRIEVTKLLLEYGAQTPDFYLDEILQRIPHREPEWRNHREDRDWSRCGLLDGIYAGTESVQFDSYYELIQLLLEYGADARDISDNLLVNSQTYPEWFSLFLLREAYLVDGGTEWFEHLAESTLTSVLWFYRYAHKCPARQDEMWVDAPPLIDAIFHEFELAVPKETGRYYGSWFHWAIECIQERDGIWASHLELLLASLSESEVLSMDNRGQTTLGCLLGNRCLTTFGTLYATSKIAIRLLDYGVDVNAVGEGGGTALHNACRMSVKFERELVTEEPNDMGPRHLHMNDISPEDSDLPPGYEHTLYLSEDMRVERDVIRRAAGLDILRALLKHGADIHAVDDTGNTPFNRAVDSGWHWVMCETPGAEFDRWRRETDFWWYAETASLEPLETQDWRVADPPPVVVHVMQV